jgi:hypothetical protein
MACLAHVRTTRSFVDCYEMEAAWSKEDYVTCCAGIETNGRVLCGGGGGGYRGEIIPCSMMRVRF